MAERSETAKVITKLRAIRQTREEAAKTVREALAAGLTRTQIHDLSGLSRQTIYNYERAEPTDTEEPAP